MSKLRAEKAGFPSIQTGIEQVGLGRSAIYKMIREGNFPAPIKIGVQAVAWQESDIIEWCEQRIAASRSIQQQACRYRVRPLRHVVPLSNGGGNGQKKGAHRRPSRTTARATHQGNAGDHSIRRLPLLPGSLPLVPCSRPWPPVFRTCRAIVSGR